MSAVCAALMLSGCTAVQDSGSSVVEGPERAARPEARPAERDERRAEREERPAGRKKSARERQQRQRRRGKRERGDRVAEGEGRDDGVRAGAGGGHEDDESSAVYPAAGNYVYAQQGYEEFCQATQCERRDLPSRQPVEITHRHATESRAVVVTETRASDNRVMRRTAVYTRGHSVVTKVYFRFDYEGFAYENSYVPDPPVTSLQFPLRVGARWSGRWRAQTSGDYTTKVEAREQLEIAGAAVDAFRLHSTTNFRGEFQGRGVADVWVAPATRAIVKMRGALDLSSAFGRFATKFSVSLRSGPAYS